ncbi:hypothetical protein BOTBODRAFT_27536 [Botryobasidium botryosum FD-172 SS1]|uniref:Uncharacterized protein n=1 Tax=Botryobasidium botryosum (strain FD-172 SS1) TaxID=930990 RepID=A0A067MZJ3_BOTB1|nr:hypothetical protein BOTBODRAFT_27536 [Botryobasidium botryosum FD-172 SS1]
MAPASSSQDNQDDDEGFAALLMKMQASSSKKQSKKEAAFLQFAKRDLDASTTSGCKEILVALDQIDARYQTFQLDYATREDKIRKIWIEIAKEHDNFRALERRKFLSLKAMETKWEERYSHGTTLMLNSAQEASHAISTIHQDAIRLPRNIR